MSYQKYKIVSFCLGGRHYFSNLSIVGDINITSGKSLFVNCAQCNPEKAITVIDFIIEAKSLGSFFHYSWKKCAKAVKRLATKAMIKPGKGLKMGAKSISEAVSESPKRVFCTFTGVSSFYLTGIRLPFGIFV